MMRGIHQRPVDSPHKGPMILKRSHVMTSSSCCVRESWLTWFHLPICYFPHCLFLFTTNNHTSELLGPVSLSDKLPLCNIFWRLEAAISYRFHIWQTPHQQSKQRAILSTNLTALQSRDTSVILHSWWWYRMWLQDISSSCTGKSDMEAYALANDRSSKLSCTAVYLSVYLMAILLFI